MKGEPASRIEVAPTEVGEALKGVRLCSPEAMFQMRQSLSKLGQLTPVQVYPASGKLEVLDGFKRVDAARALSWPMLRAEVQRVDAVEAKIRLWRCNAGAGLSELEEAWLVRALYRDDELTQPQIGQALGRHKSWVCRRLMLAESLTDTVTSYVRLGLLSATAAVELSRLQRCNQDEAAQISTRRGLTSRQVTRLVETLRNSANEPERRRLLEVASAESQKSETGHKGGSRGWTPGERLAADALAMKRLSARLHARLLERPLSSLGAEAATVAAKELQELKSALGTLCGTLERRLMEVVSG